MKTKNYKKTRRACYLGFVTQAICANFAPLLYITFYKTYNISFAKLALISTVFFFTQLMVDLFCVKIVDRIGYRPCVVAAEVTSGAGLLGLAFLPDIMARPFAGILASVIIYAIGSGLTEVLVSPIIEACPFENKDRMMSLLHSFYCWGSVGVILGSSAFFRIFGIGNWKVLAVLWALVPLYNIFNFLTCPIDTLVENGESMGVRELARNKLFWVFIMLMVCAGASELAMAQWASAFAESALHVSKEVGDLAGPCAFAILMGLSRVWYGRYGEKVDLTLFMTASGIMCLSCYLLAGLTQAPVFGLVGCALCGFAVGIMWPGSISISSRILPKGGTAMFAFLALAGDLGGALGPSIVGTISQRAGDDLKSGIIAGIGFPIILVICVLAVRKKYTGQKT